MTCGDAELAALAFLLTTTLALIDRPIDDILLDRARGFTVSKLDPVTGGLHCAIGGGAHDYVVTSTLASQCPPAVGRALGIGLVNGLDQTESKYHRSNVASKPISYVSLGDGSVNNAHFLSAANMVRWRPLIID